MIKLDNPAGRLLNLIEKLKNHRMNDLAIQAWAAVLGIPANDTFAILVRLGRIIALPKIIKDAISTIPDIDLNLFLSWMPALEGAFQAHSLSAPLAHFLNPISQEAIVRLQFCADRLSQSRPEKLLDPKDLQDLRHHFFSIRSELVGSNLPADLRAFIETHLNEIIDALQDYEFLGVAPLERALAYTAASTGRDSARAAQIDKNPVGHKFLEYVGGALLVLKLIHALALLPADIEKFSLDIEKISLLEGPAFVPRAEKVTPPPAPALETTRSDESVNGKKEN
jgi:hypothetical protein